MIVPHLAPARARRLPEVAPAKRLAHMARQLTELRERIAQLDRKAAPSEHARLARLLAEREQGLIFMKAHYERRNIG